MFRGHNFIKLVNEKWVLDLTEYKGYAVKLNSNKEVIGYEEVFRVRRVDGEIEKYAKVPIKVLKEAKRCIINYEQDM